MALRIRPAALTWLLVAAFGAASAAADDRTDLKAAIDGAAKSEQAGDYAASVKQSERALALAIKLNGADSLPVADISADLGRRYRNIGDYVKAEPLTLRVLKIREAKLGPDHVEVSYALNSLAEHYRGLGQFAKAEELHNRALKIRRAKLPPTDLAIADSLHNMASLYHSTGRLVEAAQMYQESLKIRMAAQPPDLAAIAKTLNNSALVSQDSGFHGQAELFFKQALAFRETSLGKDHPEVALSLNNLGSFYRMIGQPAEAERLLLRSLEIRKARLGADHPDVAQTLTNLGNIYFDAGKLDKAKSHYVDALNMMAARLGRGHVNTIPIRLNLANVNRNLGHLAEAESAYLYNLQVSETVYGTNHPEIANVLDGLALVYCDQGEYAKAKSMVERGMKILEKWLEGDHPDLAKVGLQRLAEVEVALGSSQQAAQHFDRARRAVTRYVARALPAIGEREQLSYLRQERVRLEIALSLPLNKSDIDTISTLSAGWLANGKAVAQAALAERQQAQVDVKLSGVHSELQRLRREIAALSIGAAKPGEEVNRSKELARLNEEEKKLVNTFNALRGGAIPDGRWIAIEDIRKSLPADAVLVDIARINVFQFGVAGATAAESTRSMLLGEHYVAWLTPAADRGPVRVINLGPAARIDAAIAAYQKAVAEAQSGKTIKELGEAGAEKQFAAPLAELGRLVLAPLTPHLADARELVLSPDAGLWLLPWAAIPAGDEKLAVERWQIRLVTSGREVALERQRKSPVRPTNSQIFADPDFDLGQREAQAASVAAVGKKNNTGAIAQSAVAAPNMLAQRSALLSGRVSRLPGTAAEAKSIAPAIKQLAKDTPIVRTGQAAQEAVFNETVKSPRILVLSTHGFFLPEQEVKASPTGQSVAIDNPLLRCGLLLAGCNQRDKYTDKSLGDGVLTGLEIVGTDLRGTELVVLSACETGLGVVNNGEGVAGLRQAFQLAGARSVVSTLWQIPDQQSAQLMTDFFRNLAAGQSKAAALRSAQLAMIKARRDRHAAAHPLYWAAWTVTGN